jgi:hypothetical protein
MTLTNVFQAAVQFFSRPFSLVGPTALFSVKVAGHCDSGSRRRREELRREDRKDRVELEDRRIQGYPRDVQSCLR